MRQIERRKLELFRKGFTGEAAGEARQQVPLLGQLFFQRRQRCLRLREGRFLGHHIRLGYLTQGILTPEKFEGFGSGSL